ncbi:MAG: hypothetical protein JRM77_09280 [Nitrososphaerota archaeon]|nr:hypothetical protein [Nitrososphaerota archaeon]
MKADADRVDAAGLKPIRDLLELVIVKTPEQLLDVFLTKFDPIVSSVLGPRDRRVFSGGPHTREGRAVSEAAASKIAELGFVGITEDSFYLPTAPKVAQRMEGPTGFLVQVRALLPTQPLRQLPRLASKAIFFESREEDSLVHLRECSEHDIPRLGYVICPVIYETEAGGNSSLLSSSGGYSQCSASIKSQCGDFGTGSFCPFHEAMGDPWPRRSYYLTRGSTIIAVKSLTGLSEPLMHFLQNKAGTSGPEQAA